MLKSRIKFTCLQLAASLLLLVGVASRLQAEEGVHLSYQFENGQVQRYRMTCDSTSYQKPGPGLDQEVQQTMVVEYTQKTKRADGNEAVVSLVMDRISFDAVMGPVGALHFDSNDRAQVSSPELLVLAGMIGQELELTLDAQGQVKGISGYTQMIQNMLDQCPDMDPADREMLEMTVSRCYDDAAMRDMFSHLSLCCYPAEALQLGDSWEQDRSIKSPMAIDYHARNTLKEASSTVATIEIQASCATIVAADEVEAEALPMVYDLSGEQFGTVQIDRSNGWPISVSLEQDLSGAIRIDDCDMVPGGMEMPMRVQTKMLLECI
jgi:hypothetical protein